MAMFPNAPHGYMPFVQGKTSTNGKNKRSKPHIIGGKLHKNENRKHMASLSSATKMYQITLRDKKGVTYKCIVKSDGSQSLPHLCEQKLNIVSTHRSLPDISALSSPERQRQILSEKLEALNSMSKSEENFSTSLDLRNCGKKEGIFSTIFRFIKEKTGKREKDPKAIAAKGSSKALKSNGGKSKRKPSEQVQRKRQRTVSAMSNLDPIAESPNEHEFEDTDDDDDDNDSYTHYSSGCTSDSDSIVSHMSCNIEQIVAS